MALDSKSIPDESSRDSASFTVAIDLLPALGQFI